MSSKLNALIGRFIPVSRCRFEQGFWNHAVKSRLSMDHELRPPAIEYDSGKDTARMHTEISKKLFTVDEYYQMAAAGIIGPEERVELIDGEVIQMSPIGD